MPQDYAKVIQEAIQERATIDQKLAEETEAHRKRIERMKERRERALKRQYDAERQARTKLLNDVAEVMEVTLGRKLEAGDVDRLRDYMIVFGDDFKESLEDGRMPPDPTAEHGETEK